MGTASGAGAASGNGPEPAAGVEAGAEAAGAAEEVEPSGEAGNEAGHKDVNKAADPAGNGSGTPAPTAGAADPPDLAGATELAADPPTAFPEPPPAAAAQKTGGGFRRGRLAFRHWRRTRPFWGGLFVALGGGEILFTYRAPFKVVLHFGLYGLAGYALPGMLVVLGLLIVFDREHRTFYSVLAMLAAAGTWLTSNLGGFILGMLLGLVGSALAYGWSNAVPAAATGEAAGEPAEPEPGRDPVSALFPVE